MFDHPSDTYVEGDDIPKVHIGSPRKVRYDISWNESLYQSDNTKGWQSTKDTDTSESPTISIGTGLIGFLLNISLTYKINML